MLRNYIVTKCPIQAPRTPEGSCMVQHPEIEMIHVDLLDSVLSLINAPSQRGWCHFNYSPKIIVDDEGKDVRCIDELWTSEWWRREEDLLSSVSKNILAIGIATDETTLTSVTGRKLQPVYAFSYNYGHWFRSKESGWMLIGFFPIVRPVVSFANHESVRKYRRLVHRWQMGRLMESVCQRKSGFFADIVNQEGVVRTEWMYPRVPFGVADEPEMKASFVGAQISSLCRRPCNVCLVKPSSDTIYVSGDLRDVSAIRHLLPVSSSAPIDPRCRRILKEQHSLHAEYNPMLDVPGYDPFSHPGCILHQLDSGVFEVILSRITQWLSVSVGSHSIVQEFDRRWAHLCSLPGGKLFVRGVSTLANVSMAEHRIMTMGLPFVVHGFSEDAIVIDSEEDTAMSGTVLEELSVTYLCWRWLLSSDWFTTDILEAIEVYGSMLLRLLERSSRHVNGRHVGQGDLSVKVHKICHWTKWIALFGCPRNWSSETWESAHKSVKQWKGTVSWKFPHVAGRRIMMLNAVYDCHSEGVKSAPSTIDAHRTICSERKRLFEQIGLTDIPEGWMSKAPFEGETETVATSRKERWGPGQFRGKMLVSEAFHLDELSRDRLAVYERSHSWFDDINRDEDVISALTLGVSDIGDISKSPHLSVFVSVLRKSWKAFCREMDVASHPNVKFSDPDDDANVIARMTLGTRVSRRHEGEGVILLWKKMRVTMPNPVGGKFGDHGYYVSAGMFMHYNETVARPTGGETIVRRHVGRVEWMVSFADRQAVILRRSVMSKTRSLDVGESASDDFMSRFRSRKKGTLPKSCKEHFATVTINFPLSDSSGYHVVILTSECRFRLDGIASVQPDFASEIKSDGVHIDFKRYFLMDYIVFWD